MKEPLHHSNPPPPVAVALNALINQVEEHGVGLPDIHVMVRHPAVQSPVESRRRLRARVRLLPDDEVE
eukprot:CAMPEP_0118651006 /NCGR_PEP_ID=MMETSP0785-20121206/10553_1 /TAXON_ID=91992 /ORGANISM="Bolidomonas pacifica, Strain CCMP 1866" /LENGTH=67 /DNA_ID=CAMNT_0006543425 /DNA_START=64 /DNA_END=267 /DNA_ORIENTATION=-